MSDLVKKLASEEGLSADVEDTKQVHDYLLQNNQSNIDFIHELARRIYFEVEVDESKLIFKKPRTNKPKSISEPDKKKMLYDLFQKAGTPSWEEAAKFALPVAGLKSWDELKPK